jgi:hypothetical protein
LRKIKISKAFMENYMEDFLKIKKYVNRMIMISHFGVYIQRQLYPHNKEIFTGHQLTLQQYS